jgi:hypothetical protein
MSDPVSSGQVAWLGTLVLIGVIFGLTFLGRIVTLLEKIEKRLAALHSSTSTEKDPNG